MPATIRLMKFGKRGYSTYRIVVIDKRKKRDGSYIEKIGSYNPHTNPHHLELNKDLLKKWLEKGAQVSEGIRKLLHIKK